jgi:hypothetical protein
VLVYSGEHYVIELLVGIAYAFAANALAGRRWRSQAGDRATGAPATAVAGGQLERAA